MRHETRAGVCVEGADDGEVEAAAVALVGDRRFREAVREHDLARREGRPDDDAHVLRPVGAIQEELAQRRERRRVRAEQQAADGGAGGRAAGLAGLDHGMSGSSQMVRQQAEVGRFAGALDPLEGDEERHGRDPSNVRAARPQARQARASAPSTRPMP